MLDSAQNHIDDLADFVAASPTSYHAADQLAARLKQAGFEQVDPRRPFGEPGGRRFLFAGSQRRRREARRRASGSSAPTPIRRRSR